MSEPSDNEIRSKIRSTLASADLSITTEKMIRTQLEEHFGCSLKTKKPVFKEEIELFLSKCDEIKEEMDEDEDPEDPQSTNSKQKSNHSKQSLSPELCNFLGISQSDSMSRAEVVKRIWMYIKDHNLQDPSNKRKILEDEKLRTIFSFPLKCAPLISYQAVAIDRALRSHSTCYLLAPSLTATKGKHQCPNLLPQNQYHKPCVW
jgi:upstream activation factor subunit UAF30